MPAFDILLTIANLILSAVSAFVGIVIWTKARKRFQLLFSIMLIVQFLFVTIKTLSIVFFPSFTIFEIIYKSLGGVSAILLLACAFLICNEQNK